MNTGIPATAASAISAASAAVAAGTEAPPRGVVTENWDLYTKDTLRHELEFNLGRLRGLEERYEHTGQLIEQCSVRVSHIRAVLNERGAQ